MQYTQLESKIESLISPTLVGMGLSVVRTKLVQNDAGNTLQIMAEGLDGSPVNVDLYSKASRAISAILDVEDPIDSEYLLEVSSPGLDRPLVRLSDFEKYTGEDAKITTNLPINGRKRFKGVLAGVEGEIVKIKTEDGGKEQEAAIPFSDILTANLRITQNSLKKILNQREKINN